MQLAYSRLLAGTSVHTYTILDRYMQVSKYCAQHASRMVEQILPLTHLPNSARILLKVD